MDKETKQVIITGLLAMLHALTVGSQTSDGPKDSTIYPSKINEDEADGKQDAQEVQQVSNPDGQTPPSGGGGLEESSEASMHEASAGFPDFGCFRHKCRRR